MNALEELRNLIPPYVSGDDIGGPEDLILCDVKRIADRIEAECMPYPLDAYGVPCKIGDHVKSDETYGDIKEMLLFERGGKRWEIYLTTLDDSVSADSLHHVEQPKLTKEEIDAKAKTSCQKYWNCEGDGCNECPAKIQGKNPNVYYEVPYCSQAQILDILRLERERVGTTCHIIVKPSDSDYDSETHFVCSECGAYIPVYERDGNTIIDHAAFCPNCGAKVADDD